MLRLEVNGQALDALDSTASSSSRSLHVPERMLRKGLNELLIQWPVPSALGEDACVRAAEQIELGQHCELFPWFGELHRLRTRRSKSAQVGLGERNSQSAHVLPDVMGTAAQHYVTQSF